MASTVAQAIATNPQASIPVQTLHNPTRSAKAADPELFDGNQDQTEEFVSVTRRAGVIRARGSGRVGLGVRTDVASASGLLR